MINDRRNEYFYSFYSKFEPIHTEVGKGLHVPILSITPESKQPPREENVVYAQSDVPYRLKV
jgi:hypothetical protein